MRKLHIFVALACLGTVVAVFIASAGAAKPGYTVVMSGLDNPRGLAFARAGEDHGDHRGGGGSALYVAEAGSGGTLRCTELRGTVCVGLTGAISRYWRGQQQRVVTGLPSYAPFVTGANSGAIGPHDISFADGRGYVVIGLAANPDVRAALGEKFGWIARFRPNGDVTYKVDVAQYEKQANPDQGIVESDPYGLLEGAGNRIVTDAAGNTLLQVSSSGSISTLAVLPSRPQGRSTDSVPTSVAVGHHGAYYVGELTGAPFPEGQANIWKVVPGRAPRVYCSGFSFIIDLTLDRHGNLYVLEHASGPGGPFAGTPGQLLRVGPDCSKTSVATELPAPTSVAIGPDGNAYVSIFGTSVGVGQVIRIDLGARDDDDGNGEGDDD
jgi:sugar lactone lactonase YvrE